MSSPGAARGFVPVAAIVLLAAACTQPAQIDVATALPEPTPTAEAAPEATPTATPEPTPEATPTATPEPTPTATPEPTPVQADFSACPIAGPRVDADLDGDAADDRAALQGADDASWGLVVCLASGQVLGSPLELRYRYLTTVDVQPDGHGELLVGSGVAGDAPATPSIAYRLYGVVAGELGRIGDIDLVTDVTTLVGQGTARLGFACRATGGDGIGELVITAALGPEDEQSGGIVEAERSFHRLDGFSLIETGGEAETLRIGTDDAAIAALAQADCHGPVAHLRFPPPAGPCAEGELPQQLTLAGDVDGDGRPDRVYQRFGELGPRIGVCTAAGVHEEITVGGMGEIFDVLDLDGDGLAEIITGGTTVSAGFSEIQRFDGARIVLLSGGPLAEGFTQDVDPADPDLPPVATYSDWGCADVLGDERREIQQVVVRIRNGVLVWDRTGFGIEGFVLVVVDQDRGELDAAPPDPVDDIILELSDEARAEVETLVGLC